MSNPICPSCGGETTEGAKFCTACGAPVPSSVRDPRIVFWQNTLLLVIAALQLTLIFVR